ncbi:MAG: hypothetical protein ACXWKA_01680 [Xanthobacteraceae bacterium]
MFTPGQYRDDAHRYAALIEAEKDPKRRGELQEIEKSMIVLADNEQWLADNYDKTIHRADYNEPTGVCLLKEEEHVLRSLGAALIMQWNTLPRKLQRELFDAAGSVGDLLETGELRASIARYLHSHKDAAAS